jgi:hypothetical protein
VGNFELAVSGVGAGAADGGGAGLGVDGGCVFDVEGAVVTVGTSDISRGDVVCGTEGDG